MIYLDYFEKLPAQNRMRKSWRMQHESLSECNIIKQNCSFRYCLKTIIYMLIDLLDTSSSQATRGNQSFVMTLARQYIRGLIALNADLESFYVIMRYKFPFYKHYGDELCVIKEPDNKPGMIIGLSW